MLRPEIRPVRGPLIVIGGHEDQTGECRILRRFVALAGGRLGRIAVVAAASADPAAAAQTYCDLFKGLGAGECRALPLASRREAMGESAARELTRATGIFLTGGDQLRITATLGGTPAEVALCGRHFAGACVAGTSAGASAMSATMIMAGHGEDAPRFSAVRMSPGLGLWRWAVIDPHFAQRGRANRLLAALSQHPGLLGIGLDEDTAVIVEPSGDFSVMGSGSVTVLDGRTALFSAASETSPRAPVGLEGVTLHVLVPGDRMCASAPPGHVACRIGAHRKRQASGESGPPASVLSATGREAKRTVVVRWKA